MELISKKGLKDNFSDCYNTGEMIDRDEVLYFIERATPIDAEIVHHGKWATMHGVITPGGDPLLYCPYCESKDSRHMGGIEFPKHWNYCPVCGTKMEGNFE